MKGNSLLNTGDFRPLVVGAPRTGFSLLIYVIAQLLPFTRYASNRRRRVLGLFADLAGAHISDALVGAARSQGKGDDLVYNPNFRYVAGGPRWVPPDRPDVACFRKYIGIRGHGDFTLITRHPRELLECQDIIHTHSNPAFWVTRTEEAWLTPFASIRNPVATLYSSCFSLNALTSEYLQHFVPPDRDNDELREHLALYKLTDLNFFTGLIGPLQKYIEEFVEVRDRYRYVMRWEDLLTYPTRTITEVGAAMGIAVDEEMAAEIWRRMSWRNLTGWHKHNYRRGHGIVGGWRRYLTNEHLALMRDKELDRLSRELGYGPIPDLEPSDYTPYQRRVAELLARGEVYRDFPDPWLFEFAFNKSNLDSSAFSYKRYEWRENTQVERSSMNREDIVTSLWDAAEAATARFNHALTELLALPFANDALPIDDLRQFTHSHAHVLNRPENGALAMLESAWAGERAEPRLLRSVRGCNIVQFGPIYYGLPQALGPIDLSRIDPSDMPGVIRADNYQAVVMALTDSDKTAL